MLSCIKGCLSEHLTGLSWLTIAGIAIGVGGVLTGTLLTGGAAAGAGAALFAYFSGTSAVVVAGAAGGITAVLSGLIGCILACATGVSP
jgi:hypothetical protein